MLVPYPTETVNLIGRDELALMGSRIGCIFAGTDCFRSPRLLRNVAISSIQLRNWL
ncbi:hypothetical protein [Paenibacillus alginolyticus]|uniref:hypothetical protein n=1 Tax=Paenibacillus alginolyticus TaxID=59839 RepID=UPI0034DAF2DA